jgi:hypothetical protein
MLHTGAENGDFYMRGRFGTDFQAIGYNFGRDDNPQNIALGIAAAAHINMIPDESMYFPVDNFYATIAIRLSGTITPALSWRLYPVYHVSAHLADGYKTDILKDSTKFVSSEMVKAEFYYKLFGGILELGTGGGWYYHVCSQGSLRYKGEISALFTPNPIIIKEGGTSLQPFALIRAENTFQAGHNPGIEASGGIFALKNKRGFGISLIYFNRLHRSYYFKQYEKGWGAEYTFVY